MSDITKHPMTNDGGSPVKVGYLVTGLVFIGLAGTWALSASGAVDGVTVGWVLPAILVGAGVIGLLAMLASGVRRDRPDVDTGHDDPRFDPYDIDASAPEVEQQAPASASRPDAETHNQEDHP
ncbi:MAG: hypothetical protein ABI873_15720 [Marmoricola sp.]